MYTKNMLATVVFFFISTCVYADIPPTTQQEGADAYDWQTCYNAKAGQCINDCQTSTDPNCKPNCQKMAHDKCTSLGFSPPQ